VEIAQKARSGSFGREPRRVAGVDVAYRKDGNWAFAAAVVLSWPDLRILEERVLKLPVRFPYVPGYLSFREVPLLKEVLRILREKPDLLFVDGQGRAHPRRCGLAVHLGVEVGIPSLGCAKNPLLPGVVLPEDRRGARTPILLEGEVVGYAVRTRSGVKPVYVSPGHGLSVEEAVEFALSASRGFRIPEPIRRAHHLATEARNA